MGALAIVSVIVSAAFAALVLRQYAQKRRPSQVFWGVGLVLFAVAAAADAIGTTSGWTVPVVKIYYLFGAMLLVGYLALGTTFITFGEKAGRVAMWILLGLTVAGTVLVAGASLDVNILDQAVRAGEWKRVMPVPARIITIFLNSIGSIILIGGAIYSGIQVYRKRHDTQRLIANVVIAAGALILASGGTLGGLLGLGQEFISLAQTPGITVMFVGFLLAGRASQPVQAPKEASSP